MTTDTPRTDAGKFDEGSPERKRAVNFARQLERELAAAKAEIERLREDAERYRWLRDNKHIQCLDDRRYYYEPYAKRICDAAIDKARKT